MRQVILQIDITLDGFAADANDQADFVKNDEEMNQDASALLDTVDTIMLGRVAYQQFVTYWPFADTTAASTSSRIARHLNEATKVVFSRTLASVTWGTWNNARLVRGNIAGAIAEMKAQPGKNLLLYAGAEIAATFIRLGLVDEYRLRVHPVLVGSGKSIFRGVDATQNLTLVQTKTYGNGAVLLNYRR